MKKLLLLVALLFSFSSTAHAIPALQLSIPGGTYSNETTVANSNIFDLNVYLLPNNINALGDTYYLSAALIRQGGAQISDSEASLGSFQIGSSTYSVTGDMTFGTPPVNILYPELPRHEIFPTWYIETPFSFDLNSFFKPAINVADGDTQNTDMYWKTFAIDLTGLADGYGIHFDLYNLNLKNGNTSTVEAPFSHDAEGWSQPVPEPGTVLLLGSGFLGLAIYGRRRKTS